MSEFDAPAASGQRPVWGVAALLLAAGDLLAARFGSVSVRGEIAGFNRASSGHCYFSLKDAGGAAALLRCAMFRRAAGLLDFEPADGAQVEVRGRVGLYEPRGELQLVVESMRRLGAGALYEEFLRLRARLEGQGLFDPSRKRGLAILPRRVAVVTSPSAAAWQDVITAFRRRSPQVEVVLVPSPVQGADAPAALARALQLAGRLHAVDAVLLVRGGGSLEDLWAFNDERVVRAIAVCARPVVCGVGHETDVTLADLAADVRAPTPTAAAELAAPERGELLRALVQHGLRLQRSVQRHVERQSQRLDGVALRLGPAATALSVQAERLSGLRTRLASALRMQVPRRLDELLQRARRLRGSVGQPLAVAGARLQARGERLQALDPHAVLGRGYVWIEDERARPVISVAALSPPVDVRAIWADGTARARIVAVDPSPKSPRDVGRLDAPADGIGGGS